MVKYGDFGKGEDTQYVSLFLPGLGNVSITHEDAPDWNEAPKLVIHVDFDREQDSDHRPRRKRCRSG